MREFLKKWLKSHTVSDIMTRRIVTVDMDTHLEVIEKLLENYKINQMPVIDKGKLVGIITSGEVRKFLSPYSASVYGSNVEKNTRQLHAHQVMTRNVQTVVPELNLAALIQRFNKVDFHCFPVISEAGVIKGIVCTADLLKFYAKSAGLDDINLDETVCD